MGEVTADLLKKIGMTVDFVATDWGTVGQRRASKNAARTGRLGHVPHLARRRRLRHARPATSPCAATARRPGSAGPTAPQVEKEVAAWFAAKDLAEEKAVIGRLNKAAMEHVVYVPTGFYYGYQAWRSNVSGVVKGPLPFFWGVAKA